MKEIVEKLLTALTELRSISSSKMDKTTNDSVGCFECGVCWQKQPIDWAVNCTEFEIHDDNFDALSTDTDTETDSSEDEEINEDFKNDSTKSPNNSTKVEPKEFVVHMFCADCVRSLAEAACVDTPLAKGAVGLRCMERNCDNVLLLSDFRRFLPSDCLSRLEERMQHETLINAKIKNLERCLKCNYGQIMKTKPSQRRNLRFTCHECGESHCRLCKNPWKKLHAGRTCWQFKWAMHYRHGWDMTQTPDFVDNETAQQLTENIVRKCQKCSITFMKSNGCNKMVCRCGASQCYVCRATDINYSHYCNCSGVKKSKTCCNKCDLFDDVKAKERKERDELLRTAKRRYETNSDTSIKLTSKRHSTRSSDSTRKHTTKLSEETN